MYDELGESQLASPRRALASGRFWIREVSAAPASWLPLLDPPLTAWDKTPIGDWEIALSSEPPTREPLRAGAIDDLALVLSYRADLPPWPE